MVFSMYDPKLLEGVRTIHFIGCGGSAPISQANPRILLVKILHESWYRMNHLHGETSPYLLQHADNPVD